MLGGLLGAVVGAMVFLPLALIPFTDAVVTRLAWVALCGALVGATAVAICWGGRLPELEGETVDVEGRRSVGTTLRDPHSDDRGR